MRVLAVASEIYPLVKTGGLADVTGALPPALAGQGVAVMTLVPGYPAVVAALRKPKRLRAYADLFGGEASILSARVAGLDLLILDAPHLYRRPGGPYVDPQGTDFVDNWRRFAALGRAAADLAGTETRGPAFDLLHAHDWQAAMAVAYLKLGPAGRLPAALTIHNLAFQGRFPAAIFPELGLPAAAMNVDGVEYYGGVGFLKAGLQFADAITTVSPTYAEEIRTPEFGMGLEGLIDHRADHLHGIVNGVDTGVWDPATDPHLMRPFSARTLKVRAANRAALERRFDLEPGEGPVFAVVSRLTWQKGMDLLVETFDAIVALGARLVVLGSGDHALEGALLAAASRHRGRAGAIIGYDEGLSHLIQGGADAILVPSRFEPCGLTQLYALRYGCVPIVARTGGLADTIIHANEAALSAGVATGLMHEPGSAAALHRAVARAMALFQDPQTWTALQKQGMKADVSWNASARRYADLYHSLGARN